MRGACWRSLLVCGLFFLLAAVPAAAAEPSGGEAGPMYQPGAVDVIDLTLPQASIDALEADPTGEYREGTFSLATTDGTPAGVGAFTAPATVGIRLKGGTGSFRPLSGKAAFKIKFNYENSKGEKGKKFLGLKKLTLNNMVQDPAMIHENLIYQAFRAVGVDASRTGYAYVYVNGVDYGLHLNLENVDDVALGKRFGAFEKPPQHLYEGEYGDDVKAGGAADFEVDEGEETELGDLEALIAAVNDPAPGDWSDRVAPVADLAEMTRMWAIEKYAGHWDGYSGEASHSGVPLPNNYYLYSDKLGQFQMLPWGTDQTWDRNIAFDGKAGLLFDKCLADESCAALYAKSLRDAQKPLADLQLDSRASQYAALLLPWQELEQSASRHPFSVAQIKTGVAATRAFIAERPDELAGWLADHPEPEPPVEPPVVPDPVKPGASPAASAQHSTTPASQPTAVVLPPLSLGRLSVADGVLVTRVGVPGGGRVEQRAVVQTRGGSLHACDASAHTSAAGTVALRCPLSAAVRRHLANRWLRLTVTTKFTPASGSPQSLTRVMTLKRQ